MSNSTGNAVKRLDSNQKENKEMSSSKPEFPKNDSWYIENARELSDEQINNKLKRVMPVVKQMMRVAEKNRRNGFNVEREIAKIERENELISALTAELERRLS